MKKIFLTLILITSLFGCLISCDKEMDNPSASAVNTTNLVAPVNGSTITLNPNAYSSVAMTVKWTSVDFGYSASVKYVLQIVKSTDSFDTPQVIPLATYNENTNSTHESSITTTVLNGKLKATGATLGTSSSFKMRVYAQPSNQLDTSVNGIRVYSQEVTFSSNVYDPIDETPKLYVMGNFGTASTFADWDINLTGTSNSPLIYSPLKDGVYEGFVYMNVPSPQYKFANPTSTDLDIKGLKTQYTQTAITGVSTTAPLGNSPGEILSTTDISTGNVITPLASATGAGTYFIKADWPNNKYIAIKRLLSLKGLMTSQQNKYFNYITDSTSPYYRMYVATNLSLSAGQGYIQVRDISSADPTKIERFGIDNNSDILQLSPDASSPIKNKIKLGGQTQFRLSVPGVYTVVLDLRNSANYNLRFISN